MIRFCGQDKCSIDANGRIKLSPRFISDFLGQDEGSVVFHYLPEGTLALYPENVYKEMRSAEQHPAARAAESMVFRRTLRKFGALSQTQKITEQGRITIPPMYREITELQPGGEAVLVGVEIGVEIWNAAKWDAELKRIILHSMEKGDREMAADLSPQDKAFSGFSIDENKIRRT